MNPKNTDPRPTVVQRLKWALNEGLGTTLSRLRAIVYDYWFDWRYRIDTCANTELDALKIESGSKEHGRRYQPTRVLALRHMFRALKPLLPGDSVVVDYGSGRGRVLFVAAEFGFAMSRGIEFSSELCADARRNAAKFYARCARAGRMETIEADATQYEVKEDETLFFFGNPFGDPIFEKVVTKIIASLKRHPRRIYVAYYNPNSAHIIEQSGFFEFLPKFTVPGYNFRIYTNKNALAGS